MMVSHPPPPKLLNGKNVVYTATFNINTLNTVKLLPELIASAAEYYINIICTQEHIYYHYELEIKYHHIGHVWIFIPACARENFVNAVKSGVEMLLNPWALKSLNSKERIQPRMISVSSNSSPCATIVSWYSPTNLSDETDIIIFFDTVSSLVWHITNYNVLIIGGDMNSQINKDGNNKFYTHNSPNRNGEYIKKFSLKNRL